MGHEHENGGRASAKRGETGGHPSCYIIYDPPFRDTSLGSIPLPPPRDPLKELFPIPPFSPRADGLFSRSYISPIRSFPSLLGTCATLVHQIGYLPPLLPDQGESFTVPYD